MALLPEVGLNCLTCVMVSASQWWMDGCQHDSVTYSPSCFSLSGGVLFTLSLVFLIPHLLTPSSFAFSRSLSVFPRAGFSQRISTFLLLFSVRFPPARLCSRLSAGATCGRWWEEKATVKTKESSLTKAPSPELACSCKKLHQLPQWLNDVSTTLRMLPLSRWMAQLGSV